MPREKKQRKNHFDLLNTIAAFDYAGLKRPLDPKTKEIVEPNHKYQVTLEPDTYTIEKYVLASRHYHIVLVHTVYVSFHTTSMLSSKESITVISIYTDSLAEPY